MPFSRSRKVKLFLNCQDWFIVSFLKEVKEEYTT
jgi:hypothetical protein